MYYIKNFTFYLIAQDIPNR